MNTTKEFKTLYVSQNNKSNPTFHWREREKERERDVGLGITSDMCSSAESQCDRTDSHTHH